MDPSFFAEDGCFVYQVVGEPIEVRYKPSDCDVSRTGQLYRPGDMVAMDRILCNPAMNNDCGGPFLRLADGTGWLFERKDTVQTMQRVVVQSGLWSFFVGNYPEGQELLRHPTDRADLCVIGRNKKIFLYDALQKIYCDRKVQDPQTGIHFYRVQGTSGWVVEKRIGRSRHDDCIMLIDEKYISSGLFAFQAIAEVGIRELPRPGNEGQTGIVLCRGQICVVDAIYKPPLPGQSDGTFLHLEDGTGWLMETENHVQLLQPITIAKGLWTVSVLYPPDGIYVYRQPFVQENDIPPDQEEARQDSDSMNSKDYWVSLFKNEVRISMPQKSLEGHNGHLSKCIAHYEPGTTLECDRKISHGAHTFYRVEKENGWIVDGAASGEKQIEVIVRPSLSSVASLSDGNGWTVDFVRGAAAVVKGVQEIVHNKEQEEITFKTSMDVVLHVYYAIRTVGITRDDPELGKTQLFCRDCSNEELGQIFLDPPMDGTSHRRQSRRRQDDQIISHSINSFGSDSLIDEEGYRNELLDVEQEFLRVKEKEHELLRKIDEYDERRCMQALYRRRERKQRAGELELMNKNINQLVKEKVREIALRQEREYQQKKNRQEKEERERRRKLDLTCLECYMTFRNAKARDLHCRVVHSLYCCHCSRIFRSSQDLDEHCMRRGHY